MEIQRTVVITELIIYDASLAGANINLRNEHYVNILFLWFT